MKMAVLSIFYVLTALVSVPLTAFAGPDDYIGDTAIYGGSTAGVQPNVLIILDTSGSMNDEIMVDPYDPDTTYPDSGLCNNSSCSSDTVYTCNSFSDGACSEWASIGNDVSGIDASCGEGKSALAAYGQWTTGGYQLTGGGNCLATGGGSSYVSGNWINWVNQSNDGTAEIKLAKIEVAKRILKSLIASTTGVRFGFMVFDSTPDTLHDGSSDPQGGEFAIGTSGDGDGYKTVIKDMDGSFSGSITNRQALREVISHIQAGGWTPLAETLFEARRYFRGEQSAFTSATSYTSPVSAKCQANYVILISDGMSTRDDHSVLRTICTNGDCDGDNDGDKVYANNGSDYLDDVARELYNSDLIDAVGFEDRQNVATFTVGFGLDGGDADAVNLLQNTAQNGGGKSFLTDNYNTLAGALSEIITEIVTQDTSFTTPVVPISPDNRAYSGNRVYLGMFEPVQGGLWKGNLKKFGLDPNGNLLDVLNQPATASDGSILKNASSYWGGYSDGGKVAKGGVWAVLQGRDPTTRKIYSDLDASENNLAATANAFDTSNPLITAGLLGISASDPNEKDNLILYVRGQDAFDNDLDGDTTENRSSVLGDILHSEPAFVHYKDYDATGENNPSLNHDLLFAGANDGMLHAFSDADGQELWAFIPENLLPNLRYLRDNKHASFVDSSPAVFIYDQNGDNQIDDLLVGGKKDLAVLVFGQRRGGGNDHLLASQQRGTYYALDISNRTQPKLLWKIDNQDAGFEELGETWAKPAIATIRQGGKTKIVAIFGAGYDNNEDLRYGNTQKFSDTTSDSTDTTLNTQDSGAVTSNGNSDPHQAKGRGVYVVEIAHVDSNGVLVTAQSATRIWGFTFDPDAMDDRARMTYAMASDVSVIDTDFDGFDDRFYIGDTGGNMWRFDIGHNSTAHWKGNKIFSANPEPTSSQVKGRKIFSKPSVTLEVGYTALFFGTGDRAHPMNTGTLDRFYAFKDRGPEGTGSFTVRTEANLMDVTEDLLQAASPPAPQSTCSDTDNSVECILERLEGNENFGWFIQLDSGEKILSPPVVFNKVAYFTTYTPTFDTQNICGENLGDGYLYAVQYRTGEAAQNFDPNNDVLKDSIQNSRAKGLNDEVLMKSDRRKSLGQGIPSGAGILLPPEGEARVLVGNDGRIMKEKAKPGGRVFPIYWMEE